MAKKTVLRKLLRTVTHSIEAVEAAKQTPKFQENAVNMGWPDRVAKRAVVAGTGFGLNIKYPKDMNNDVLTAEYGTEDSPPSPAIRNFIFGNN